MCLVLQSSYINVFSFIIFGWMWAVSQDLYLKYVQFKVYRFKKNGVSYYQLIMYIMKGLVIGIENTYVVNSYLVFFV